ncbi:BAG family molecular chaperone regulator 3 isoform X2 [Bacillus rossius redtenbacheri]|uniref:BAG family molecular chaperone regulator 3 isoform X2 n=1 Tax=Bacillus rossius redtenbacheri TaxID=93214 RepID=UPI002FDD3AA0
MADNSEVTPLPPGWDRKYDHRSGRYYYINYFSKTTTWEDPRLRYWQLAQAPPPQIQQVPILPETIPLQDLTNIRPSPIPGRAFTPLGTPYSSPSRAAAETSLSSGDLAQSVLKISAMFPTVSDTHIRTLLLKYHNREAVVMSALQVEKHPISTPGPYATPPLQNRHFQNALQMTPPLGLRDSPRAGSPVLRPGSRSSYVGSPSIMPARPHSSPKMKLRYLKSVFPKAEETLLLDILANSDNNVQKATEKLVMMGFEKRDTPPPRLTLRRREEEQKEQERRAATPTPPPRMKSSEEKQKMKGRLQDKYPDIPERLITIALDSVDYDEDRAFQILSLMVQEEEKSKSTPEAVPKISPVVKPPSKEVSATDASGQQTAGSEEVSFKASPRKMSSDKGQAKRPKAKKDISKVSRGTSTTEDKEYKSPYITKPSGPDRSLCKGSNDALLLPDYAAWNGPNPELLQKAPESLAKGPNKLLLQERLYKAKGPNSELRKGPMGGLARGSIYSQLSADKAEEESRGK